MIASLLAFVFAAAPHGTLVAVGGEFALTDAVSTGVAIDWPRFERMGEVIYRRNCA